MSVNLRLTRYTSLFAFLLYALGAVLVLAQEPPINRSVLVEAVIRQRPFAIRLRWPDIPESTSYEIYRKRKDDVVWTERAVLQGNATEFLDEDVIRREAWEYKVVRRTNAGYSGYGYIWAGAELPLVDDRGIVILLVDSTVAAPLAFELSRLESDLVGDGWEVRRMDVSPNAPVPEVRERIRTLWAENPQRTRSVFLFGRVPIPYSGNITPDFHPNHEGAWPADVYYGDMDGVWTDTSVTATNAERQVNWNLPGDGKFDQSSIPSDVELQVGRVDLRELTCFLNKTPSRTETDLLRNYLNKNHNYRRGLLQVQRRGYIIDFIGIKSNQDPVGTAYRNFSAFFGSAGFTNGWSYFSHLNRESALWAYMASGGSYHYAFGIGTADNFAMSDIKAVFTMFLGSYYGDWNHESNFMRAALGSDSYVLTTSYSGAPNTFYHHMGLGETIGHGIRISQNNHTNGLYAPEMQGQGLVHISILGDPTLRLHPIAPPSEVTAGLLLGGINLTWKASPDPDVVGYHVYRADNPAGPYQRMTTDPVTGLSMWQSGAGGMWHYMVKAIKLERSGSGSYFNSSQGIYCQIDNRLEPGASPSNLRITKRTSREIGLAWDGPANAHFEIERRKADTPYATVGRTAIGESQFVDRAIRPGETFVYRVRALGPSGHSAYLQPVQAAVPAHIDARVSFVQEDTETAGNWLGKYGGDGWDIARYNERLPSYAERAVLGAREAFSQLVESEPAFLQQPTSTNPDERVVTHWWIDDTFELDVNITDGRSHRVSVYFVDSPNPGRHQKVEVLDHATGSLLDERNLQDFGGGKYLVWDIQGRVRIRVSSLNDKDAIATAIFFDTPTDLPRIEPRSGAYPGAIPVTLRSVTTNAVIHYTLDGSEPTLASPRYTGPLVLEQTSLVKAKAFSTDSTASGTASSSYFIGVQSGASGFVIEDSLTRGAWSPTYGQDGHSIPGTLSRPPQYVNISLSTPNSFTWADPTQEGRALAKTSVATDRIASCWYADEEFTVSLRFEDENPRRVGMYFMDWDRAGRVQKITIQDAETGNLLDEREIGDFSNGKYLVWDLKGHVVIKIKRLRGTNAVLMGLFFGPANSIDTATVTPILYQTSWQNGFQATVLGLGNSDVVVETSETLDEWTPLSTVRLENGRALFREPENALQNRRFFRVRTSTAGN